MNTMLAVASFLAAVSEIPLPAWTNHNRISGSQPMMTNFREWAADVQMTVEDLATNQTANVEGAARPLPKYLHALDFSDSYTNDAAWYYEQAASNYVSGSCSARRLGGLFERNYDWTFDDTAEFVVRMGAGPNRFASVGVANVGTNLTEQIVTSGRWSRWYKCLPGHTLDGINERGVVAEINVLDGDPQTSGWHAGGDIHPLGAVRWALDHATSAGMAASNLAARIAFPHGWTQNFHYMVADERETWVVRNGRAVVSSAGVLTNFDDSKAWSGEGLERYFLLAMGKYQVSITNAWWTPTYTPVGYRASDLPGVDTNLLFAAWAAKPKEAHRAESFGGTSWWQTVHTSVYDITNRVLRVAVQEQDDWYVFSLATAGVDEGKVRGIVESAVTQATNAIGPISIATSDLAGEQDRRIQIGAGAEASGPTPLSDPGEYTNRYQSIAIGLNAKATNMTTIAIGSGGGLPGDPHGAKAYGKDAIAIGYDTLADNVASVVVGDRSSAVGVNSVAIGANANASNGYSVAIGKSSNSSGVDAVAVGRNTNASGSDAITIGRNSQAQSTSAIAIGSNAKVSAGATAAVQLGNGTCSTSFGLQFRRALLFTVAAGGDGDDAVAALGKGFPRDWLKTIRAIRYVSSIPTNQLYDGSVNCFSVNLDSAAFKDFTLVFPAKTASGKARSFCIYVQYTGKTQEGLGTMHVQTPSGATVYGDGFSFVPELYQKYLFSVDEITDNSFLVTRTRLKADVSEMADRIAKYSETNTVPFVVRATNDVLNAAKAYTDEHGGGGGVDWSGVTNVVTSVVSNSVSGKRGILDLKTYSPDVLLPDGKYGKWVHSVDSRGFDRWDTSSAAGNEQIYWVGEIEPSWCYFNSDQEYRQSDIDPALYEKDTIVFSSDMVFTKSSSGTKVSGRIMTMGGRVSLQSASIDALSAGTLKVQNAAEFAEAIKINSGGYMERDSLALNFDGLKFYPEPNRNSYYSITAGSGFEAYDYMGPEPYSQVKPGEIVVGNKWEGGSKLVITHTVSHDETLTERILRDAAAITNNLREVIRSIVSEEMSRATQ